MHPVILKTFGGLSPAYYFRHFVFGIVIGALAIYAAAANPQPIKIGFIALVAVNALLYPYSRFVYESVISFIVGKNTFYLNAFVMLFTKLLTMTLCWALAIFVAPIGLAYLYVHHSRANGGT
jgi:hypothetical protein